MYDEGQCFQHVILVYKYLAAAHPRPSNGLLRRLCLDLGLLWAAWPLARLLRPAAAPAVAGILFR